MKILIVGATGTIGSAVARSLEARHEVLRASRTSPALPVDIADPESIKRLYAKVGRVDAVVGTALGAAWGRFAALTDADFAASLAGKLMGQVNLVRYGVEAVADGGSFTITSGVLSRSPMPGSAAASLVNAGLEGFARAAAIEVPRGIRVNAVSPGWARETLIALKMDPNWGVPASVIAAAYVGAVEGTMTGQVLETGS